MPAPTAAADDVLSLDDALGSLLTKGRELAPQEGEDPPPAGANDDVEETPNDDNDDQTIVDNDDIQDDDDEEDGDEHAAASQSDKNAPADEGKTNAEDGDQGDDALPPIEAPASWTTEEKAVWNATPRKAQEAILRRELDGTKAIRDAQNKSAEQQKAVDAEVGRLKELSGQIDNLLNEKVAELAKDFPEVKSEADLVALATSDPARAQLFNARLLALQGAQNAKAKAQQELAAKAEQEQKTQLAKAKEALIEAFPAWKEPDVARREIEELQNYAISQGAPEAAARASVDPVIFKLAQKAMLYDRAQAAKAAAATRTPPRVVNKPGTNNVNPRVSAREEQRRIQLARLDETGSIEDAIGLLRG